MAEFAAFHLRTRVEDRVGNRGVVIEEPWKRDSEWFVKIKWNDPHNPTAIGIVTDERIVNLTIVP